MHSEILHSVGLTDFIGYITIQRDPYFRHKILEAYQYKCAVCDYNLRMGNKPIGLEAAHIKWHQAGGPNIEKNGLALCSLHHKLFDYGAFSLDENLRIIVSRKVYGNGLSEYLLKYEGKNITKPLREYAHPDSLFTEWHVSEVYKDYN